MGLFSFLRKNKQDPASSDSEFYSRAEEESSAVRGRGKRKNNQANEPADPVLPEKKRARRRLVGAIALVLAAIIGLPMVFDSEPKPVADDITIQIPSKDKPVNKGSDSGQPVTSSLSNEAAAATLDPTEEIVDTPKKPSSTLHATAAVAGGAAMATAIAMGKNKDADKSTEAAKSAGVDKTSAQAALKNQKPEQKTSAKIESKVEPKSELEADRKLADAAKLKVNLEKSASGSNGSKTATDKKTGKFMFQVAALISKEKINELQGKLKKAGFTISTQKAATKSGMSTRIRVGPYATKEEADKAHAKLIKMGLNGTPVPTSH